MNVAAAVANGSVDCGMGIRAAANALDLDFVPVAEERYDLVVPRIHLEDPRIVAILHLIRNGDEFHQAILRLGGYSLRHCGEVVYEQ